MKLFLLTGLHRSGRSFLGCVLNQNPNFFVPAQSPLLNLLYNQFSLWEDPNHAEDFAVEEIKNLKSSLLYKYTQNFFSYLTDKKIFFDNRMKWASKYNINMYKTIFGSYPKMICCVRNMEDIIASFNSLYNKNNKKWDLDENIKNIFFDNYNYIKDVYNSNYRKHLLLVHYEDLVQNPEKTLIQLYNFIEEPYYKHDFNSIKINKSFSKVEKIYGMKELHNIKKGLIKSTIDPHNFLSPIQIKKWEEFNFWK